MPWYDERHTLARLKAETDIPIAAGETEYTPFGLARCWPRAWWTTSSSTHVGGGLTTWRKAAVMAELYQVPLAAHHDPQSTCTRWRQPTGFIWIFADPRAIPCGRAVPRAPGHRRRLHGGAEAPGLGLDLRDDTLEKYGVRWADPMPPRPLRLAVTTASPAAAERLQDGMDRLLAYGPGASRPSRRRCRSTTGSRWPRRRRLVASCRATLPARDAVGRAQATVAGASRRERQHVEAVSALVGGETARGSVWSTST